MPITWATFPTVPALCSECSLAATDIFSRQLHATGSVLVMESGGGPARSAFDALTYSTGGGTRSLVTLDGRFKC